MQYRYTAKHCASIYVAGAASKSVEKIALENVVGLVVVEPVSPVSYVESRITFGQ